MPIGNGPTFYQSASGGGSSSIGAYRVRYSSNAGNTLAASGTRIIDFEDIGTDPYSLVTTGASWHFTAPTAGVYSVKACITSTFQAWTLYHSVDLQVWKNGAVHSTIGRWEAEKTDSDVVTICGSTDVELGATDTVDIRAVVGTTAFVMDGTAYGNWVTIRQAG